MISLIAGRTTEKQYAKISGNWDKYLARLLYAGGKGRKELTVEDLKDLLLKQNYRCALTGVPLTCNLKKGVNFQTNASIDRIEAGGTYTSDNVQLVCKAINYFRMNLPVKDFIWWCSKVASYSGSDGEDT